MPLAARYCLILVCLFLFVFLEFTDWFGEYQSIPQLAYSNSVEKGSNSFGVVPKIHIANISMTTDEY